MQNKTDKGTSLVSKSLPIGIFNSVNRLLSTRNEKYYDSQHGMLSVYLYSNDFLSDADSHSLFDYLGRVKK